jgi:hypothetical protein
VAPFIDADRFGDNQVGRLATEIRLSSSSYP